VSGQINGLRLRQALGRELWKVPEDFGPDGWRLVAKDGTASVIVTVARHDGHEWIHASIARVDRMPTYDDLVELHHAVWGETGFAYQVFAPRQEHVNIHEHALHLWGRLDGADVIPRFGMLLGGVRSI
jgi:hypothetical protein